MRVSVISKFNGKAEKPRGCHGFLKKCIFDASGQVINALLLAAVVSTGCSSTPKRSKVLIQGMSDGAMLTAVEAMSRGVDASTAKQRLSDEGFHGFLIESDSSEGKSLSCVREDHWHGLVSKKWILKLNLDEQHSVSSVSLSSALIGP